MRGMLDFAHDLVLRAASQAPNDDHDSPALEDLIECKMVERGEGQLFLTELGQLVLSRSAPTRQETWVTRVLVLCLAVLAIGTVVGWVT